MERMDDLLQNGLVLYQDDALGCFGADAVFLAHFLHAKPNERVVELGSGTGVICILGADDTGAAFTGVETQDALVRLAQKSAAKNGQAIRFLCADAAEAPALLGHGTFDAAATNPPYFTSGDKSKNASRALSRHAGADTLDVFLKSAFLLLKNGGRFYMIYPAVALANAFMALRAHRLEPKRLRFIQKNPDSPPTRALIEARKDGGAGLSIEPPLFTQDLPAAST